MAGRICTLFGRLWFAGALLFILSLWIAGSFASHMLLRLRLLSSRKANDVSISIGTMCAKILFVACPHVALRHVPSSGHCSGVNWQPMLKTSSEQGAPPLLLMNHSSFLDLFVICASMTPSAVLKLHLRCVLAAKLTRLPLLGKALGAWSGNFPAHFKEDSSLVDSKGSSFATDQSKQAAVAQDINAHVAAGGMLGLCPEGTVNATPATLAPFRHGTFKIAIEHRMPIFGMVAVGCNDCWPKREVVGGYASTVYVGEPVHLLTPTADMEPAAVADECRRLMQEMYDNIRDLQHEPSAATPVRRACCRSV